MPRFAVQDPDRQGPGTAIIVAGRIYVRTGTRDVVLNLSAGSVARARRAAGCLDFVVAADPLDVNRVNVYEEWGSESALIAFRGSGPAPDLIANVVDAQVSRYQVQRSGPRVTEAADVGYARPGGFDAP
jgi:quinol monooxygenase YgiN